MRASALAIQACAGARASGGSLASSASAPAMSPCARALLDRAPGSRRGSSPRGSRRPGECARAARHWPAAGRGSRLSRVGSRGRLQHRPDDGRKLAVRAPRRSARRTRRTARAAQSPPASGASGLTMASSAANGSPRSTALRSADAATASRDGAVAAGGGLARGALHGGQARAVSLSILPFGARPRCRAASAIGGLGAARDIAADVVGAATSSRSPPRSGGRAPTGSVTGARGAACALSSLAEPRRDFVERLRIDSWPASGGPQGRCNCFSIAASCGLSAAAASR